MSDQRKPAGDPVNDRLIPLPEVMSIVGYGKTIIYRWIKQGTFPKPCHPGGASSRWSEAEVRAWKDEQLARREAPVPAGEPGECEQCGEDMPRLVEGRCAFCRDGRRPPASWYEARDAEARAV